MARLEASDKSEEDQFGYSVALDGELLAVGSGHLLDEGSKQLYVFERGEEGWAEVARVEAPDAGERFGHTVAVGGDQVFVADVHGPGRVHVVECR